VPDINLNNKTVPYGRSIVTGGVRAAKGLGHWIRNTLCSPWSKS